MAARRTTTKTTETRPSSVVGTSKRTTTTTTRDGTVVERKTEVATHGLVRPTTRETHDVAPQPKRPDATSTEKINKAGRTQTYTLTTIGSSKKCAGCGEVLATAPFVEACGKPYHTSGCFVCSSCGTRLNVHRFFVRMSAGVQKPVCENCKKKI